MNKAKEAMFDRYKEELEKEKEADWIRTPSRQPVTSVERGLKPGMSYAEKVQLIKQTNRAASRVRSKEISRERELER